MALRTWRRIFVALLAVALLGGQALLAHPVHAGTSDDNSDDVSNGSVSALAVAPGSGQCQPGGVVLLVPVPQGREQQGRLSLSTNQQCYSAGDRINICYSVPSSGQVTLYDTVAGHTRIVQTWQDDGTGDCGYPQATASGQVGSHCLRLRYWYADGSRTSTHTCFNVR